jgi:hypothetical protein
MTATISPTNGATQSELSAGSYKILGLLRKGCAYSVRGSWRFRGVRGSVREQAFQSLLAWGLAERVEGDRCAQVRITPAGRSIRVDSNEFKAMTSPTRRYPDAHAGGGRRSSSKPLIGFASQSQSTALRHNAPSGECPSR